MKRAAKKAVAVSKVAGKSAGNVAQTAGKSAEHVAVEAGRVAINLGEGLTGLDLDGDGDVNDGRLNLREAAAASAHLVEGIAVHAQIEHCAKCTVHLVQQDGTIADQTWKIRVVLTELAQRRYNRHAVQQRQQVQEREPDRLLVVL